MRSFAGKSFVPARRVLPQSVRPRLITPQYDPVIFLNTPGLRRIALASCTPSGAHIDGVFEAMKSIHKLANYKRTCRTGITLLVFAGMAASASAADIPARAGALPPAPIFTQAPAFTWSGFYIGANAGLAGGGGHRNPLTVTPPGTGLDKIGSGSKGAVTGGLQAGYNWQAGNLVLGIETDIQTLMSGRHRFGPAALPDGTLASGRESGQWYGTLRPRVGYAFDRTLLYVTGGLAYGGGRLNLSTVDPGGNTAFLRSDKTRIGWTIGSGVEYAFTRNWSTKLEYQFVNLGPDKLAGAEFTPGGIATGRTVTTRHENSFHTIKAGLNYRF